MKPMIYFPADRSSLFSSFSS